MEVILSPHSGFCFGVKRAMNIAEEATKKNDGPIYTYGPIIHNPQTVSLLKKKGITPIDSFDSIKKGRLIIRSHGVSPSIIKLAKEKGFEIIDATCPFVKKAHDIARKLNKKGYKVIAIGEKEHPEMQAVIGYTNGNGEILSPDSSFACIKQQDKIGVIAQTTLSISQFQKAVSLLVEKAEEIRIYNTICNATSLRQEYTIETANKVDLMLVIGGKNSANTRRLYELVKSTGKDVYHIETKEEIKKRWFRNKEKVGITAGASTPVWIIKEVIHCIKEAHYE